MDLNINNQYFYSNNIEKYRHTNTLTRITNDTFEIENNLGSKYIDF